MTPKTRAHGPPQDPLSPSAVQAEVYGFQDSALLEGNEIKVGRGGQGEPPDPGIPEGEVAAGVKDIKSYKLNISSGGLR